MHSFTKTLLKWKVRGASALSFPIIIPQGLIVIGADLPLPLHAKRPVGSVLPTGIKMICEGKRPN